MDDLVAIARRHLAAARMGEKGGKVEKPSTEVGISPFKPFYHRGRSEDGQSTPGVANWEYRAEASRLIEAADSLVECLGLDGSHPEIVQAAATVDSALVWQDIEMLRTWVFEFELLLQRISPGGST